MVKVGFTGTQSGWTHAQGEKMKSIMFQLATRLHEVEFHHGDCIGADEQAHEFFLAEAEELLFPASIIIHPPTSALKRAYCASKMPSQIVPIHVRMVDEYMKRNQAIVNECELLVATPARPSDLSPRSGTWATTRRAFTKGVPVVIVHPNGDVEGEVRDS